MGWARSAMQRLVAIEVAGSHAIYVSQPKAVAALSDKAAKDVSALLLAS